MSRQHASDLPVLNASLVRVALKMLNTSAHAGIGPISLFYVLATSWKASPHSNWGQKKVAHRRQFFRFIQRSDQLEKRASVNQSGKNDGRGKDENFAKEDRIYCIPCGGNGFPAEEEIRAEKKPHPSASGAADHSCQRTCSKASERKSSIARILAGKCARLG